MGLLNALLQNSVSSILTRPDYFNLFKLVQEKEKISAHIVFLTNISFVSKGMLYTQELEFLLCSPLLPLS